MHFTVESPWRPVSSTMPFILLLGPDNVVIIEHQTLWKVCGIDITDLFNDLLRWVRSGGAESTSPSCLLVTQTQVHMTIEAFSGSGMGNVMEEENSVVMGELLA